MTFSEIKNSKIKYFGSNPRRGTYFISY